MTIARFLPALLLPLTGIAAPEPMDLRLPTGNEYLFSDQPEKFYMYVDRTFEGVVSTPWTGGQYGFTRTPIRTAEGVLYQRFHEGIDIAPMQRDKAGNPLDLVNSIAAGRVAYVSPVAGRSNYGKYVVVEHDWGTGPVYSLYAHLATITCEVGQTVRAGATLGQMGFTGAGLNRTRAHVHLELNLMASERFDDWMKFARFSVNHHGNFNGMNLIGLDIADLYLKHRENPDLTLPEFVARSPIYFKVNVPRTRMLPILERYPWLIRGDVSEPSAAWEISFTATGFPAAIAPSNRAVTKPTVTEVRETATRHRYHTRGLIDGTGDSATLARNGQLLVALVTDDFPEFP